MAPSATLAELDPDRDFERLRSPARRRFIARARRAGQDGRVDLDQAADDAYQEAWLELQRRPAQAVIEHDQAGYLAGIMWHRFHRLELRPARVETAPLEDAAGGAEPDALVEERQTLAAVRDALASLPERERTAVLLRAEGFGHDDIAATLGVSRRIARKLAERGRAGLSRELETEERCASIASTLRAIGLGWPVRGDRRARLEEHVADCATCRATVVELRREGALVTTPAVLAGDGALTRLRDALEGALASLGRGGEAAAAAAGTKLVAGCLTAGVCVVGAVQFAPREAARPDPAPRAAAVARATATPTAQAVRAATPVPSEPQGAAAVRAQQREEAVQRTAEKRAATAVRRARAAQKRALTAARQARAGAERARAAAVQSQAAGEQARSAGERAADAGRTAAQKGTDAANRARDAADRVRDALAPLGGG